MFFRFLPVCSLRVVSVDDKVLQEVRNMGQGVTEVDYLTAYGPIGLGVALTIDDNVRLIARLVWLCSGLYLTVA